MPPLSGRPQEIGTLAPFGPTTHSSVKELLGQRTQAPALASATETAIRETVEFLQEHLGLTNDEAYSVTSMAVDLRVTELVDGSRCPRDSAEGSTEDLTTWARSQPLRRS